MTEQEARDDLERKVRELLEDAVKSGLDKLVSVSGACSGIAVRHSGIVEEHLRNDCNWVCAREFMVAFARDLGGQHMPALAKQSKAWRKHVDNLYMLM